MLGPSIVFTSYKREFVSNVHVIGSNPPRTLRQELHPSPNQVYKGEVSVSFLCGDPFNLTLIRENAHMTIMFDLPT